ncbi:MAG: GIY-YIG nuclease family protein [Oscillospiraceae bacterium]|nr:GIY-YIG nuclease family protein [Oscillospiraceae bacterium]
MYWVYLLRCEGGTLYAGITVDPARRLRQHRGELPGGARYTAAHPPLGYAALWTAPDRSAASKLEARLKRLSRADKESVAAGAVITGLLPEGCVRAAP